MEGAEHWTRARELFLDLTDAEADARAIALAKLAAEDPELCAFVQRLLAQDAAPASPHTRASGGAAADAGATRISRCGPYELLEPLGEGGFGTVYRALQSHPIARVVAVKVQRGGRDAPELARRFEDERRFLARIEHPDVVKVLDAGVTADGRLFIAMELVDGVPIHEHFARTRAGVRERVALVARVARVVHHVHQRAILHRDLKPSNILVTTHDGEARPRLIDFGLATAVSNADVAPSPGGRPLCTPGYAAPEQLAGSENVDVRADVHALGCILCECLTGALPRPDGATPDTLPRRPSKLVTQRAADGAPLAAASSRDLRGDLDHVVLKCVAWEPERRYESAAALADDLERYLRDEPVLAAPPSTWYVARKFARRNRALVSIIATALALVLVAAGVTLDAARRARLGRAAALDLRDLARAEALRAEAVTQFLLADMVQRLDIDARPHASVTIAEMLGAAEANAATRFASDPRTRSEVLALISRSYSKAGRPHDARRALQGALDAALEAYGAPSVQVYDLRLTLSRHFMHYGDGDPEEPRRLAAAEADALFPPDAPERLALGISFDTPVAELRALVARLEVHAGRASEVSLVALRCLAKQLEMNGRQGDSMAVKQELLIRTREALGPNHSAVIEVEGALAMELVRHGVVREGGPALAAVRARADRLLGADHATTRALALCQVTVLLTEGRVQDALVEAQRLAALARDLDGPRTFRHANALSAVATVQRALGAFDEALRTGGEVLSMRLEHWGPDHIMTRTTVAELVAVYAARWSWSGRRAR